VKMGGLGEFYCMELSEFAHRILFSCDVNEKLAAAVEFTDVQPFHPASLPTEPGRPTSLALGRWKSSKRVSFPTRAELLDPVKVGVLLHFFANHELLALELMALTLLKFPSAPAAFRMGVAKTMLDEQRHLASYLAQMKSVGVELGDIPVNDFFWTQCSAMKSPLDYVARMSLTFEQANLDFASYFRDVLVELGDVSTAALLQTVLDDEIGHVKHGLVWFRRWKPESKSDWQAFCEALGGEINPARAKGSVFDSESRLRVGFDQDFIDSLKIFSQSKGGLPKLSFYNPEAEEELRLVAARPQLSSALGLARDDLAAVMIFVLNQDDILAVPRRLPRDFLVKIRDCGFDIPELLLSEIDEKSLKQGLGQRKILGFNPWAVTPWTLALEKTFDASSLMFSANPGELRPLYSKVTALDVLKEFLAANKPDDCLVDSELVGSVVACTEEFESLMQTFCSKGLRGKFIAKRPWSAAGRHRIIESISDLPWAEQPKILRQWFENSWRIGELPIVQPLFKRRIDVSVQARIAVKPESLQVHILGFTRVLNLPNGQYAGTCVGRILGGQDNELLRFWHKGSNGHSGSVEEILESVVRFAGESLAKRGYTGSFGIDAFVFERENGTLGLFPMIEINPRHTMGRVALSIGKRMAPGRVGLWLHIPAGWLRRLCASSFAELRDRWTSLLPLRTQTKSGGTVVVSGVLETSPAEQCQQVWTCFAVGTDLKEIGEVLSISQLLSVSEESKTNDMPAMRL